MKYEDIKKLQTAKASPADIIVAIDPDVTKSGVALLISKTKELGVATLTFAQLVEMLRTRPRMERANNKTMKVFIEAGWLNKSNWHLGRQDNARTAAFKGHSTGRNHQVGRLLCEICDYYGVDYEAVKPLKKCWRGKDGKITQEELEEITHQKFKRMNQDARDAALIAWIKAGLPVQITASLADIFKHATEIKRL